MNTLEIARLEPGETDAGRLAAGIAGVVNAVVAEGENMALAGRTTAEEVRARAERLGARGGFFYAEERDHVVAFALLQPVEAEPATAVLGVWVLPEHRRRGLGTELSRLAVEFAQEAGYSTLRGTIPGENEPALSFFSAVGPLVAVAGGAMQYELPV